MEIMQEGLEEAEAFIEKLQYDLMALKGKKNEERQANIAKIKSQEEQFALPNFEMLRNLPMIFLPD